MQHVSPLESLELSFGDLGTFWSFSRSHEEVVMEVMRKSLMSARKKLIEHPVIRWKLAEMTRQAIAFAVASEDHRDTYVTMLHIPYRKHQKAIENQMETGPY